MSLKNEEIDQSLLRDKLHNIKTAITLFEEKYSKYFNEDDKALLLKIHSSIDSIKNELNSSESNST